MFLQYIYIYINKKTQFKRPCNITYPSNNKTVTTNERGSNYNENMLYKYLSWGNQNDGVIFNSK